MRLSEISSRDRKVVSASEVDALKAKLAPDSALESVIPVGFAFLIATEIVTDVFAFTSVAR